jgi:hypothetical protein
VTVSTFTTRLGGLVGSPATNLRAAHAAAPADRSPRWGMSYVTYVGEHERRRLVDTFWSLRVRTIVDGLPPVFW